MFRPLQRTLCGEQCLQERLPTAARAGREMKTGWHFSGKRMKKKSLLSVMGTHPDPG